MKMNQLSLDQQEKQFELDLSYKQWLIDNNLPLTNSEIDEMETTYQPLQGA